MQNSLHNEQILVIGFPAWEGDYLESAVQLVSELAKDNTVLYVEYPFTWKDAIMGKLKRSKAPWRRMLGREERLRKLSLENGGKVNVLTLPPILPVNFINGETLFELVMGANARKAFTAIKTAMKSLGFQRPVVVNTFNPFLGVYLARQFDEKALIYYCSGEISAAKWVKKHGERLERKYMLQVDAIVASSKPLLITKQPFAKRSFLVKNGIDFDRFSHQLSTQHLSYSPHTVGYLGSLDERIDYDLLESLAMKMPDRRFIFVGSIKSHEAERLRCLPNVELAGSQTVASLPFWMQKFDVCMVPFLTNKLTAGIYPFKINEYFAAGKPVVTTNFGDLEDFRHMVSVADTHEQFANALEVAFGQKANSHYRITFAHGNSWRQRAADMGIAINQVVVENQVLISSGESVWVPDNFNRWGDVSAAFFQSGRRRETNSIIEVVNTGSEDLYQKRVSKTTQSGCQLRLATNFSSSSNWSS